VLFLERVEGLQLVDFVNFYPNMMTKANWMLLMETCTIICGKTNRRFYPIWKSRV